MIKNNNHILIMESDLLPLLSESDKNILLEHIEQHGYDTINDLTNTILKNINQDNDYTLIDTDLVIMFDLRTNYKVFITEYDIYTREQVIEKYNLTKFKLEPEQIFNNQKIEVINDDYFIFDEEIEQRKPQKIYNTKIYIGKEKWKDFIITFRFMRSMSFILENRLTITDSDKNKESEKNKETEYIDKVLERVLNNDS